MEPDREVRVQSTVVYAVVRVEGDMPRSSAKEFWDAATSVGNRDTLPEFVPRGVHSDSRVQDHQHQCHRVRDRHPLYTPFSHLLHRPSRDQEVVRR